MASAASLLPGQQEEQGQAAEANPEAVSRSASSGSGSIGPFFAVLSVLTVLTIISCVAGRIYSLRTRHGVVESPLESIKYRGCLGWFKRRWCRQCMAGEIEAGAKVTACAEDKNNDAKPQEPPQV